MNSLIDLLNENIAELQPKQAAASPEPEKWSRENHPAFKKTAAPVEEKTEAPVNYQVNDTVLAKWLSGDKGFYPARITSITGSSAMTMYTVKFKSYDSTETLRSRDLRPFASNKRKADGPPAAPSAPGLVSSAGATVYPAAKKAAPKPDDDEEKPSKPKKIKAKKELEAGKAKWQAFNAKGKTSKSSKKESMFRTPDGIHGRGMTMRIDYEYDANHVQSALRALAKLCERTLRGHVTSTKSMKT